MREFSELPVSDDTFLRIKWRCNGMLHEEVYRAIYEAAASAAAGNFVEVGTAHGAATVCLALGKRNGAAGGDGTVYSVDKIVGGSREDYGTFEENLELIRKNLSYFGVDQDVRLLIGDVEEVASQIPSEPPISLLMLDADGRIDRDFSLFYNHVTPGGTIIIDDYADLALLGRPKGRVARVDLKQTLAFNLVNYFCTKGLLHRKKVMGATFFAEKPAALRTPVELDLDDILRIYRQLVFVDASFPGVGERSQRALGRLVRRFPPLYFRMKKMLG